jgi:hypothetical protein
LTKELKVIIEAHIMDYNFDSDNILEFDQLDGVKRMLLIARVITKNK